MSDLLLITRDSIPKRLHGADLGYALRALSLPELLSIEDRFFAQGETRKIPKSAIALVLPNVIATPTNVDEFATLAEFSLSLLTVSGHPSFFTVATFSGSACTHTKHLTRYPSTTTEPKFAATINGPGVTQWLQRCLRAQRNLKERMHITASRYVRYVRSENSQDALMDLSISLESLLDSQTEISFRFGSCLAKVAGAKGKKAEDMATLLSDLYDVRSKIAHGDPAAAKLIRQIQPKLPLLHELARRILTIYMLYLSDHSRDDWKSHLRSSLYA